MRGLLCFEKGKYQENELIWERSKVICASSLFRLGKNMRQRPDTNNPLYRGDR
jgi:hypothetical protein